MSTTESTGLATKVINARIASSGAKLFFSLAVGVHTPAGPVYVATIRDLALRESTNGKGDYVSFPSKPRVKKTSTANPITYEQQYTEGKAQYDSIVDLYFEGTGDTRKVTPASWDFRKQVIEQAVLAYTQMANGEAGRGPAAVAATTPAGFATTTGAAPKRASLFADDNDMPF